MCPIWSLDTCRICPASPSSSTNWRCHVDISSIQTNRGWFFNGSSPLSMDPVYIKQCQIYYVFVSPGLGDNTTQYLGRMISPPVSKTWESWRLCDAMTLQGDGVYAEDKCNTRTWSMSSMRTACTSLIGAGLWQALLLVAGLVRVRMPSAEYFW